MILKKIRNISLFLMIIIFLFSFVNAGVSTELTASLAQIPGLADTPDKGAFVDIVKAIDDVYTGGTIKIELFPFARSLQNVIDGKADFHIPMMDNPNIDYKTLPYAYATERMGKVSFVIYSHVDKPITKKMIDDAIAKGGKFPYKIEVFGGAKDNYNFPVFTDSNVIDQTLQKIQNKRIDAGIYAQEEGDLTVTKLKLKSIYRSFYRDFYDIIIIPKGTENGPVDKILSESIRKLKKSGRLDKLYSKLHVPYKDWQPAKMNW